MIVNQESIIGALLAALHGLRRQPSRVVTSRRSAEGIPDYITALENLFSFPLCRRLLQILS